MSDSRIATIVKDLIGSIERLVAKHRITAAEYRAAVGFLKETAEAGEIPPLLNAFLEALVVNADNRDSDAANAVRADLMRPVNPAGSGYSLDFDGVREPDS
jgi:hypothetical protein